MALHQVLAAWTALVLLEGLVVEDTWQWGVRAEHVSGAIGVKEGYIGMVTNFVPEKSQRNLSLLGKCGTLSRVLASCKNKLQRNP